MIFVLLAIFFLSLGVVLLGFYLMKSRADAEVDPKSIYIAQLRELDHDVALGHLSKDEADHAALEIKRRLLRAKKPQPTSSTSTHRVGLYFTLIPVIAALLYLGFGRPDLSPKPYAKRYVERAAEEETNELIEKLQAHLLADENGGDTKGWLLLAQSYANQGRYDQALWAYERVLPREGLDAATYSRAAEAMIGLEGGIVNAKALDLLDQAEKLDPNLPAISYYRAMKLAQDGQMRAAYDMLIARISKETGEAPWLPAFARLAQEYKGLIEENTPATIRESAIPRITNQDIEALSDLTSDERMAFIESMVSRLQARLEPTNAHLDGWIELGEALIVIRRRTQALEAFSTAERILSENPESNTSMRYARIEKGKEDAERLP